MALVWIAAWALTLVLRVEEAANAFGVDAAPGAIQALRMRSCLLLATWLLAACSAAPGVGAPPAKPSTSSSASASAPASDFAPTPFTAQQIRDASKTGRKYRWKVETEGKPPVVKQITFVDVQPDRVKLAKVVEDDKGMVLESDPGTWSSWEELRRHAEFPKSAVTIRKESITVPAGTFPCAVYTVKDNGGEISTYWFADTLPGAPVQFKTEKDGKQIMISRLLEHQPGI